MPLNKFITATILGSGLCSCVTSSALDPSYGRLVRQWTTAQSTDHESRELYPLRGDEAQRLLGTMLETEGSTPGSQSAGSAQPPKALSGGGIGASTGAP